MIRTSAWTRSSVGRHLVDVDAGAQRRRAQLRLAVLAGLAQPAAEVGVARVDDELLAGLRVLDDDHAGVGELVLARVEEADRDDLVTLGQLEQRALPPRRGDEVGDEHDERASPDRADARDSSTVVEVGDGAVRPRRAASGSGRARAPGSGVLRGGSVSSISLSKRIAPTRLPPRVSSRAKVVASSLRTSSFGRSIGPKPIDARPVEQEPRRQLAILGVLPDERRVHPRGHVPVDVADVVARLVLAEVEEVQADAAERRAVVALEQAVEAADDLPLEAVEELLGRLGAERGCAIASLGSGAAAGHALPEARAREPARPRGCGR